MQTNFDVALPQRLKELRGDKTQDEIASLLGVKQQTYAHWELGRRQPKLNDLCLVALHFGVSADWLLGLVSAAPKKEPPIVNKGARQVVAQLRTNAEKAMRKAEELIQIMDEIDRTL